MRSVSLEDCAGAAPAGQGVPSRGSLTCALRARLGGAVKDAGLESLTGRLDAAGRSEDGRFEVTLAARTDPAAAWFGAFARAELSASGRLDRPLSEARLSHRVRATVDEARYEDVLARLKDGDWAIPAPFNALQGTFSAEAESGGDPRSARPEAAYRVSVRLAGGRQLLRARAEGTVSARRRRGAPLELEHEGTLTLEDAALDLPRLEAGAPPRVFSDPRIRRRSREAAAAAARPARRGSAPSLRWRMAVRTVKPVTVHSNLAATPVPVAMALTLAGPPSSASGGLFMKPFRVELFRRTASVRHLHVAVSSAAGGHGLDGVVVYEAPRARVTIRLLGTTERPRVELTSEPPLKREDIIALLIFNKTPEELDPEQSASVGNTESALESRAFGLASLYLFGATPVEHVGYDTASRTTTVKLRLPGGASLALGSDFDQSRELRLRKTLAPHWALESEVTDQGRENRAATTFLEWFNRY
ncbi:MAG: translocation/assembly module TamB [Elusimicrobiota bacterium]|nr:MAG: translocation/assembly module TamB [Elusimicrobiota bacterium]